MSVGKTANKGTVSVFTKDGVNVFKEEDTLITCKGKPIFIRVRDGHGRYRILLMQQQGQWQLRRPSKQARKALRKANSVYDLPLTKQAIKWMHAVCGGSGSLAAAAAAAWWQQLSGGSLKAAAAVRQQWQQWQWQHCNSATAVPATLAAWWQCGGGSLMAA
jgi:hypothetical protein